MDFSEQKIDAIFAGIDQCHLPGAAVGIALHGRPVYRKGFGLAHMEAPAVLSASTRMRIYSITKHFTCFAYLLLCEAAMAGIDDPISKYFPELFSHNVAVGAVTMRQLMGNRSGLRNPVNLRWELGSGEREIPIEELLALYRDLDVNLAVGSAFDYNNSNFELLAVAIERIAGQSFEEALRTLVFEPVGMHGTLLRRVDSDFVPHSATMHTLNAAGTYVRSYLPGTIAGSAGIVSTVDDMLRWLKHMDAPVVGGAETWALMKTPQLLTNDTTTNYGCGLVNDTYRGVETLWHNGNGLGANSQMLKVPRAGLDIVVMVNRSDLSSTALTEQILEACLPALQPPSPVSARQIPTGVFRSPTAPLVIEISHALTPGESIKAMASINGMDAPFAFDGAGVLRLVGPGLGWLSYAIEIIGEAENPRAIKFTDFGNVHELEPAQRTENVDGTNIAGRYRSRALATGAQIIKVGDEWHLEFSGHLGRARYKLRSLVEGVWTATQIDIYPRKHLLYFDQDALSFGYVSYSTRTSPLRFERCS